jgi:hypothetical protein
MPAEHEADRQQLSKGDGWLPAQVHGSPPRENMKKHLDDEV